MKKDKPRRESVEQRLDTMSSTLLAMKEIMEKSGILDTKDNSRKGSQKQIQNKGKNNSQVGCGETTTFDIQVDPEIVFEGKQVANDEGTVTNLQNASSSSEEPVNSSNEIMEVDMDFNDRFIADCEREAAQMAKAKEDQWQIVQGPGPKDKALDMIKQAEANKARILATPGNLNIQHNNLNLGNIDMGGLPQTIEPFEWVDCDATFNSGWRKIYCDRCTYQSRPEGQNQKMRIHRFRKNSPKGQGVIWG